LLVYGFDGASSLPTNKKKKKKKKNLVLEIIRLLELRREKGYETFFYWIPAHIGVPGNEFTDEMAKWAMGWASRGARDRMIKGEIKDFWMDNWRRAKYNEPGSALRRVLPDIRRRGTDIHEGLTPVERTALVQARTGKIGLNAYLYTIKKVPSSFCACHRAPETLEHLLLYCSQWEELRHQHWGDTQSRPTDLTEALGTTRYAGPSARILLGSGRLPYLTSLRTPDQILQEDDRG
jgi:hypothetical protein